MTKNLFPAVEGPRDPRLPGDLRPDWCGISYAHGPHGPKSKMPCPGYAPLEATRSPKMSETTRVRRKDVEEALAMLSRAAVDLGLRNRYEIEFGSKSNGVGHVIVDYPPDFDRTQATVKRLGKDFRTAFQIVTGMAYALQSARRELARQEEVLTAQRRRGTLEGNGIDRVMREHRPFADPDARTARRAGETDGRDSSGFPRGMV